MRVYGRSVYRCIFIAKKLHYHNIKVSISFLLYSKFLLLLFIAGNFVIDFSKAFIIYLPSRFIFRGIYRNHGGYAARSKILKNAPPHHFAYFPSDYRYCSISKVERKCAFRAHSRDLLHAHATAYTFPSPPVFAHRGEILLTWGASQFKSDRKWNCGGGAGIRSRMRDRAVK